MAKAKTCAVCGAKIKPGHDYRLWDAENCKVVTTCQNRACTQRITGKKGVKRCS